MGVYAILDIGSAHNVQITLNRSRLLQEATAQCCAVSSNFLKSRERIRTIRTVTVCVHVRAAVTVTVCVHGHSAPTAPGHSIHYSDVVQSPQVVQARCIALGDQTPDASTSMVT
jgi:hypothetical protein